MVVRGFSGCATTPDIIEGTRNHFENELHPCSDSNYRQFIFFNLEPDCKKRFENIMRYARYLPGKLMESFASHFATTQDINLIKILIFNCIGKGKICRRSFTSYLLNVSLFFLQRKLICIVASTGRINATHRNQISEF